MGSPDPTQNPVTLSPSERSPSEQDADTEDQSSIPLVIDLPPLPALSPIPLESQPIPLNGSEHDDSTSSSKGVSGSSNSNLEVSSSKIIWANQRLSKEEKIWNFAHKIGVNGNDEDQNIIKRIHDMEIRDKESKRKMDVSKSIK